MNSPKITHQSKTDRHLRKRGMMGAGAAALHFAIVLNSPLSTSKSTLATFKPIISTDKLFIRAGKGSSLCLSVSALKVPRGWGTIAGVTDPDDDFEGDDEWLRKKPLGFGEGKTYDTTVESELLEEMERSRKVLLATINKKKKERESGSRPKNKEPPRNVIDVSPSGIHVRLWNLPKKKNIHRDLKEAFKGFPGILNISPAVIANQKTRDPICKGFAFINLKSEWAANRFIQTYSKQNVLFGKVQKQIMCDLVNPQNCANSSGEQPDDRQKRLMQTKSCDMGDHIQSDFPKSHISLDSVEKSPEGSISDVEEESTWSMSDTGSSSSPLKSSERENEVLDISYVSNCEDGGPVDGDDFCPNDDKLTSQEHKQTISKKKKERKKLKNTTKLTVPSSAARLKIRERAVLTGVFSKYGRNVAAGLMKEG